MSKARILSFLKDCLKRATLRFRFVAYPTLIWIVIYRFQLFSTAVLDPSLLWAAAILFVLGIPLSPIFGIDTLTDLDSTFNPLAAITLSLFVAYLNFFVLTILGAAWRSGMRRIAGKLPEKSS